MGGAKSSVRSAGALIVALEVAPEEREAMNTAAAALRAVLSTRGDVVFRKAMESLWGSRDTRPFGKGFLEWIGREKAQRARTELAPTPKNQRTTTDSKTSLGSS